MTITVAPVPAGARWQVPVTAETTMHHLVSVNHDGLTYEDDSHLTGLTEAVRARALELLSRGDATVIGVEKPSRDIASGEREGSTAAGHAVAHLSKQVKAHRGLTATMRPSRVVIELSDDTLALRCVAGGLQELAQAHRSDHVPAPDRTAAELDRYARRLAALIPDPAAASTRSVRHFGADEQLTREQLVPGTSARRYTEPGAGGHLELRMPCCERPARVRHGVDHARALIGCPYCHLFYDATVIDELDGGFAVLLEVRTEEFVMARPHRPRRRPQ